MSQNIEKLGSVVAPSFAEKSEIYTIDEVAKLLKCTRRHIQRLIATGKIRVIKLGAASRIDSQALAEDLERLTASVKSND